MKYKIVCLLPILLLTLSVLTAQETSKYVDVNESNERIARLERENENHTANIAANEERKAYLDNRIQTSESRLATIDESLSYARETNLELNELNSETKDRETRDRLESSRNELMSVIWILSTEETSLKKQVEDDKAEVEFLTKDSARRELLKEKNDGEIGPLKQAVADTESKISEISSKLETIIGKLDGLREEATGESTP